MKICLLGCANSRKDAPFADPSWTIWAHASCQYFHPQRVDCWFDMHNVSVWRQGKTWYQPKAGEPSTYVDWLASRPEPVVMQDHYPIIPTSEKYPLVDIVETFGIVPKEWGLTPADPRWWTLVKDRGEFTSTACYMLALALYEGVDEVMLAGIDFWAGSDPIAAVERNYQRPGMKYWVGIARGLGIPVNVAGSSYFEFSDRLYGYEKGAA